PSGDAPGTYRYGLLGTKGFLLHQIFDPSVVQLAICWLIWLGFAALVPVGPAVSRFSLRGRAAFGFLVPLPYCLYANWRAGGGWLAQSGLNWGLGHGLVDISGASGIHALAGVTALAGWLTDRSRHRQPDEPIARTPLRQAALIGGALMLASNLVFNSSHEI